MAGYDVEWKYDKAKNIYFEVKDFTGHNSKKPNNFGKGYYIQRPAAVNKSSASCLFPIES